MDTAQRFLPRTLEEATDTKLNAIRACIPEGDREIDLVSPVGWPPADVLFGRPWTDANAHTCDLSFLVNANLDCREPLKPQLLATLREWAGRLTAFADAVEADFQEQERLSEVA